MTFEQLRAVIQLADPDQGKVEPRISCFRKKSPEWNQTRISIFSSFVFSWRRFQSDAKTRMTMPKTKRTVPTPGRRRTSEITGSSFWFSHKFLIFKIGFCSEADLEKLYEQWEEADEDELPPDELPDWDPRKPKPGIDFSDMSKFKDPEDFLKVSKKGQSLMAFVRVWTNNISIFPCLKIFCWLGNGWSDKRGSRRNHRHLANGSLEQSHSRRQVHDRGRSCDLYV